MAAACRDNLGRASTYRSPAGISLCFLCASLAAKLRLSYEVSGRGQLGNVCTVQSFDPEF